jgi:hypothetical protein
MSGWIKLHRSLLEWEWYDDINVCRLFTHFLLKANHKDKKYRGTLVPRGSLLTGRELLAAETGLTQQQIRTALTKLKSTNEITIKTTNKGSLVTLVAYESYQDDTKKVTSEITSNPPNEQPTSNQQVTTNKNVKNVRSEENNTSTPNGAGVPVQKIVDLYHEVLTDLPAVRQITSKRKAQIQQRWKSSPKHQDLDFWRRYFDFVSQSPFLMGQIPPTPERPKPFRADLEWLTNESNFTKVIENKYHG